MKSLSLRSNELGRIYQDNIKKSQMTATTSVVARSDEILMSKTASDCIKSYANVSQVSFGKKLEDHRSWGANVIQTKEDGSQKVSFKLWAPKATKVYVEIRDVKDKVFLSDEQFKEEKLKDKWAGDWHLQADADDNKSTIVPMEMTKDGVFTTTVKLPYSNGMYRYILEDKNGRIITKTKDPVAKAQPHIFSWSQIYDNNEYKWTDDDWVAGKNPAKVSDLANKSSRYLKVFGLNKKSGINLMKPSNLIVRQVNIPTLTKEGDLESAKQEIDKIAKDGIYNAILLMPVEGTYGENWGYDGVDKYAVSRGVASNKGKEDAVYRNNSLKDLINYAHSKNINVGMDWVPSHIFKDGPTDADAKKFGIKHGEKYSGNYLSDLAPYEKNGNWGGRQFNLEDANYFIRSNVRDYLVNMPMNWVDNYHIDFLRADQTPEMGSNYTMKQVAQEIKYHFPHTVLHWEDHRTEDGLTRNLTPEELPYGDDLAHLNAIDKTNNNNVSLYNIGGNEHWDFAFSHAIEALLLNQPVMGYNSSVRTLANNIKDIGGTKYFMSHDEIGNDSGSRLMVKVIDRSLKVSEHLDYRKNESPAEKNIRALDTIHDLFELYQFDRKNWDKDYKKLCNKYGLSGISKEKFENIIEKAKDKHKSAIGLLFMVPGSKMMFQGDAYGEINPFRFTRNQAINEPVLEQEKGYKFEKALKDSKIDPNNHTIDGIYNLSKAMSDLVRRNPALKDVQPLEHLDAMTPLIDENNKIMAIKRFDLKGNEVVALYNFGDKDLSDYRINHPVSLLNDGTWIETINSDDKKFGGSGRSLNKESYNVKNGRVEFNLPSNGFIVLEKINSDGLLQYS